MDLLSLSSALNPPFSSLQLEHKHKSCITFPNQNASFLSLKPSPVSSSLKLKATSNSVILSSPQIPATAIRGAESDAMGLMLKERIVFLGNNIDDFLADAIISQMLLLDAQDPAKDIRLFINSPGGSLSATMAIYDVVQLVRADVSTVAIGIAASTASIILVVAPKEAPCNAKHTNNDSSTSRSFTGRSFEQVLKDIDRDRYMSPMEAVEYGI
ncbi:ATP-dependent Clp protease proteolytic subunit 4 [Hibiscus syriacus]|uniref:ATP-dependent Clp protease proteolytic subunit n=1 Tax=Hibiscus syriacus TaxID=106335 RepID=A0A6A2YAW4_HIBSY|nr:ATP-dependent Clp protease proteolytic subunit 4 [Hibiscus syriacus]